MMALCYRTVSIFYGDHALGLERLKPHPAFLLQTVEYFLENHSLNCSLLLVFKLSFLFVFL